MLRLDIIRIAKQKNYRFCADVDNGFINRSDELIGGRCDKERPYRGQGS